MRSLLQSENDWKTNFHDNNRKGYTALWRSLLKLELTDEALHVAEQGSAQGLTDLLRVQYGLTVSPAASSEPREMISSSGFFLAVEGNAINFWILKKEKGIHFSQKEIEDGSTKDDAVAFLMNSSTVKEIGAGVDVRCENRSLDSLEDSLSSNKETSQKKATKLHCMSNSLRPLHDAIIRPIVDLVEGDE